MRLVTLVRVSALFLSLSLFLTASNVQAQTLPPPTSDDQLGMQPYQSYHGGQIDSIGLSTGTLSLDLPFLAYPQRGKLGFSFNLFYNNEPQHISQGPCPQGRCTFLWGYPLGVGPLPIERGDAFVGWAQQTAAFGTNINVVNNNGLHGQTTYWWANWVLQTADGSKHTLGNLGTLTITGSGNTFYYQASGPWETLDATGWKGNGVLIATASNTGVESPIIRRSRRELPIRGSILGGVSWEEDPNGNTITQSNGVFTDSLGRQIPAPPTASSSSNTDTSGCPQPPQPQVLLPVDHAVLWSVPGPNGVTENYKFCYVVVTINIPPGPDNAQAGGGTSTKLQSILLPNGQTWDFQYNDPGDGSMYNQFGSKFRHTYPS